MPSAHIHHFPVHAALLSTWEGTEIEESRSLSVGREHLAVMNSEQLSGLGLEPMVTTSELAEYLRVDVQAIYDLRLHDRGPKGIRVGRELRFRVSDVRLWLDGLHEPEPHVTVAGGEL